MRSFAALLVTVLLAVSLAACGGEDGDDPGGLYGDTRAAAVLVAEPS